MTQVPITLQADRLTFALDAMVVEHDDEPRRIRSPLAVVPRLAQQRASLIVVTPTRFERSALRHIIEAVDGVKVTIGPHQGQSMVYVGYAAGVKAVRHGEAPALAIDLRIDDSVTGA